MKKLFMTTVPLAALAMFISSAQAVIKIEVAEVQNGAAFIQGNGAVRGAQIFWEGSAVTTANKNNGGFSFFGVVPNDCVGALSDQPGGTTPINVQVLDCAPVSAALAPVPRTGQTTSHAAGDDGDLHKGVVWPVPRFTDNGNGTITDNLTRLIWLKNGNCFVSAQTWANALAFVNAIANGQCGLTDGSMAGDWRLPNIRELYSLIDFGRVNPALPLGHPFLNLFSSVYWSSTTFDSQLFAWAVDIFAGNVVFDSKEESSNRVTAVRGGL